MDLTLLLLWPCQAYIVIDFRESQAIKIQYKMLSTVAHGCPTWPHLKFVLSDLCRRGAQLVISVAHICPTWQPKC